MRLNQVIAIEKGIKTKRERELTELYKQVQHPHLFDGFSKTYDPKDTDGEQFPAEVKRVQTTGEQVIKDMVRIMTELVDVSATREFANTQARADVVIDGKTILKDVPVGYLLFLEKQLNDVHTLIKTIPTLDPAQDWKPDANGMQRTTPSTTGRTKKVQKAIVLYPATDKHPAQTQMVTEDVTIGHWTETKLSGALPAGQRQTLLERCERLQQAVKRAREEANTQTVEEKKLAQDVFSWLLG